MWVQSLGQDDLLEEEMSTRSGILAWKIPWTAGYSPFATGVAKGRIRLSMHTLQERIKYCAFDFRI